MNKRVIIFIILFFCSAIVLNMHAMQREEHAVPLSLECLAGVLSIKNQDTLRSLGHTEESLVQGVAIMKSRADPIYQLLITNQPIIAFDEEEKREQAERKCMIELSFLIAQEECVRANRQESYLRNNKARFKRWIKEQVCEKSIALLVLMGFGASVCYERWRN